MGSTFWEINGLPRTYHLVEKRLCELVRKFIWGISNTPKMTKMIQNNNKAISLKKVQQRSQDQISISQNLFHDTTVLYKLRKIGL